MKPVTLITGASSGIGVELARIFARHGHALALTARRVDRLNTLADEIEKTGQPRPIVIAVDLTQPDPARFIRESRLTGWFSVPSVGVFALNGVTKAGDSQFTGNATGQAAGQVRTGALEGSGVDAARTMVEMMSSLRAYEAGQKAITTIDDTLGRAAQLGSMR